MINRIRDIRRQKGLTLADVAARCVPPTTAQTIGRLETGTRNLSLVWMNRIGAALEVDPELLVRSEGGDSPQLVARLGPGGAEALPNPRDALLPTALSGNDGGGPVVALAVEISAGEYRAGDQIWLRQVGPDSFPRLLNRDVLAPRPGGRFAFGRLLDRDAQRIAILPPGVGQRQIVIDLPPWLAVAEMLIRSL
ncbi:MAG TPA: helix-turn-helix transcriptional regulator [Novosphingobium sp.]|nr:helix-turn-helix transcriptional regulator [Novosphingobium sp.]HZV08670.1 helix-turn-helix transcriptional regulator [Novosphingobium sp.]